VKVRFYGRLADAIGREIELDVRHEAPVGEIRRSLAASHPGAAGALRLSRACVRDVMADDNRLLSANDDLEFLPPVSGG